MCNYNRFPGANGIISFTRRAVKNEYGRNQVVFANRVIGGRTLFKGCYQEEIRFITWPEVLGARMMMENMLDNEAIVVKGISKMCTHSGYDSKFRYGDDYTDTTPVDVNNQKDTTVILMDAKQFNKNNSAIQYNENCINRDLNKVSANEIATKIQT